MFAFGRVLTPSTQKNTRIPINCNADEKDARIITYLLGIPDSQDIILTLDAALCQTSDKRLLEYQEHDDHNDCGHKQCSNETRIVCAELSSQV